MACPTLEIDAIAVPVQSLIRFNQQYEEQKGEAFRRTADGTGYQRTTWSGKLATEIEGEGWIPSAFENLAVGVTFKLKCAVPRVVTDVSNVITLPVTRRVDAGHLPYGYGVVDGFLVATGFDDITGDVYTLTPVPGAQSYRCNYYPDITVAITRNTSRKTPDSSYEWQIAAQEV